MRAATQASKSSEADTCPKAAEVVLDQEARIEPERLGLDARLNVIAEASRRIVVPTWRLGAAEQAEPHSSPSRRTLAPDCDRGRMDRVKRGRRAHGGRSPREAAVIAAADRRKSTAAESRRRGGLSDAGMRQIRGTRQPKPKQQGRGNTEAVHGHHCIDHEATRPCPRTSCSPRAGQLPAATARQRQRGSGGEDRWACADAPAKQSDSPFRSDPCACTRVKGTACTPERVWVLVLSADAAVVSGHARRCGS